MCVCRMPVSVYVVLLMEKCGRVPVFTLRACALCMCLYLHLRLLLHLWLHVQLHVQLLLVLFGRQTGCEQGLLY